MTETQGDRIIKIMEHFHLNQEELAGVLEITQEGVSKMISRGTVSKKVLNKLGESYKISKRWLLTGAGEMLPSSEKEEKKPVLDSEKVWQEMAMKQMKTIADLVTTNQQQSKTINLLSEEISLLNRRLEPVKSG